MTSSFGSRFAVWWLHRSTNGWWWLLPAAAMQVADDLDPHRSAATWLPFVAGLLAGAAWQVLSPRDLASRFTLLAVVLLAVGLRQAFTGTPTSVFPVWRENYVAIGILSGLVLATHAYRSRWLARLAATGTATRKGAAPAHS